MTGVAVRTRRKLDRWCVGLTQLCSSVVSSVETIRRYVSNVLAQESNCNAKPGA